MLTAQFAGTVHPDRAVNDIVWELRAPRGLMAIIVGAGLAMAGVAMQTLVRNPLADPYLLGISSGASVGATAVITLGRFPVLASGHCPVALLVGAMVAVAGGIGFVGLVIPHFARLVVGSVHRQVIPVAVFGGALFLLWVDVLARLIAPPQEIPLGVVTGVIGAPVFLLLMGRSRYRFGGQS